MADIKTAYGSNNQSITITLASLANNGVRSSAAIDNSSNKFLNAFVQVKIKSNAAGTSATGYVSIYAYATADGGTSYPEGCGTDVGVTLTVPTNLREIGRLNVVGNGVSYISEPLSVKAAFDGDMPDHWGIAIGNFSGAALDSTEGNHLKFYQGIYATSA